MAKYKYTAKLRRDNWGRTGTPEILYPEPERGKAETSPVQFRLADGAWVKVGSHKGKYEGLWGRFAKGYYNSYLHQQIEPKFLYYIPLDYSALDTKGEMSFEVVVVEGAWECDPEAILSYVNELEDKVSRRNQQIENLRNQLAATRQC